MSVIDFKTRKILHSDNVPIQDVIDRFVREVDGLMQQYEFDNCGFVFVFVNETTQDFQCIRDCNNINPDVLYDCVQQAVEDL